MKGLLSILLILFIVRPIYVQAQQYQDKFEVSLMNDNDVYLLKRSDRYYTNGIFVNFMMRISPKSKSTLDFELGHSLYTGGEVVRDRDLYWDRQFAAKFSLKTTLSRFIDSNRVFRYGINLEQVGPKAKGEEIQNFIHNVFNMYELKGWDSSVSNSFGIDLFGNYEEEWFQSPNNVFAISTGARMIVGTHNVLGTIAIPVRLGRLKSFDKSVFSKGHLNDSEMNDEFYVFYRPSLTYQVKNSSFGDSRILDGNTIIENELVPFVFTNELGFTYAKKRSTFTLALIRYNSEIKYLKYSHHQYGSLKYSYRF